VTQVLQPPSAFRIVNGYLNRVGLEEEGKKIRDMKKEMRPKFLLKKLTQTDR
jgi:hypothetical protein